MAAAAILKKIEKSPYLAVVRPISTKFGMATQFGHLERSDR